MTQEKELRIAQIGKTQPDLCQSATPDKLDELKRFFKKMESGVQPDFLEIMTAISNLVAFYTDCDSFAQSADCEEFFMSQKKCRFCP